MHFIFLSINDKAQIFHEEYLNKLNRTNSKSKLFTNQILRSMICKDLTDHHILDAAPLPFFFFLTGVASFFPEATLKSDNHIFMFPWESFSAWEKDEAMRMDIIQASHPETFGT